MLEGYLEKIFNIMGFEVSEKVIHSLSFFIVGSIEILLLIFVIMTFVSLLESYIDKEKLRKRIENGKYGTPYIFATFLGVITPFCSCSSIPMFIGFLKSRIPLGVALSFLVTSPLVNEIVFVMLGTMFSWTIAIIYAVLGISLGILVGFVIDKLKLEKEIRIFFDKKTEGTCCSKPKTKIELLREKMKSCNLNINLDKIKKPTFISRIKDAMISSKKTLKDMYKIVLIGIGIGAIIHGYVPKEIIVDNLASLGNLAVPLATLFGVPMYSSVAAVVPIVAPLPELGVSLGTTVAFLMSVAALSLPEAMMLKKVMSWKLISIFFGVVAIGIIFIGYMIDIIF